MADMATNDAAAAAQRREAEGERQGEPVITPHPNAGPSDLPLVPGAVSSGPDVGSEEHTLSLKISRRKSSDQ